MQFQFASFAELAWMEGHGPYVWAAYIIAFTGICGLGLRIRLARKNFYRLQASILKRQQSQAQSDS